MHTFNKDKVLYNYFELYSKLPGVIFDTFNWVTYVTGYELLTVQLSNIFAYNDCPLRYRYVCGITRASGCEELTI